MNNKAIGLAAFIVGAAVGAVTTWLYTKTKYERIAQNEIDSVKEVFSRRGSDDTEKSESAHARVNANQTTNKPSIAEYAARLHEQGYTNYSNFKSEQIEKEGSTMLDKPYTISPDEFGENEDYQKISLTYYADQVLTDDLDMPLEDVEEMVGFESLDKFGEYEDDSVYVRNDRLKCDYEILRDLQEYSEVIERRPHEVDD